jgi:hypothetical protein
MLIDNCHVAGLQEKAPAAVYSAFCTIAAAVVNILSAAAIGILRGIGKIDMAFRDPIGIRHFHARSGGKQ